MAGSYLLDTNLVIAILNQEDIFEERLKESKVYVSSTVLGELYYGAHKSARTSDNLQRIASFLVGYEMLACDKVTAEEYGIIKAQLEAKGHPIPENDIWIAAIARQYALTLVTRDDHFKAVDGLTVETW